jgi:integrase
MRQFQALPASPQTVALYITDRASPLASGTITRRLTSITKAHQNSGFTDSPASTGNFIVGETLKGIRRTIGTAQKGKSPLLADDIRAIIAATVEGSQRFRDRALFLAAFAGAFRRSELARMDVRDLKFTADGVVVSNIRNLPYIHLAKPHRTGPPATQQGRRNFGTFSCLYAGDTPMLVRVVGNLPASTMNQS